MLPTFFGDDTFRGLKDLQREMDRLFEGATQRGRGANVQFADAITPYHDVEETESHYLVSLDFPGVPKDQIHIELKDGRLVVWGEAKRSTKSERSARKFHAEFLLPDAIDEGKVEASYEHGVLTVALPKAEAAKPRQIKISEGQPSFLGKLVKGLKNEGARETEPAKPEGERRSASA